MMRLFIALPLDRETENALGKIILDLKQKRGRVKWVAANNIHLTVKFLGETDENKVAAISEAVKQVAEKHSPVESVIDRLGGFPNLKKPRVIWAGLKSNIEKLEAVALDVDSEMQNLGFEPENRKFKSHLTLGRVKDSRDIYDLTGYMESYTLAPLDIKFDTLVLFKSTLTPRGPIYERLLEAKLRESI